MRTAVFIRTYTSQQHSGTYLPSQLVVTLTSTHARRASSCGVEYQVYMLWACRWVTRGTNGCLEVVGVFDENNFYFDSGFCEHPLLIVPGTTITY